MKNDSHDSLSFKLLALVIIAGVIAAFVDPSAKASAPPKTAVAVTTIHHSQSSN